MMRKEILSGRQSVCIVSTYIFGSSIIIGINSSNGQDAWICLLLAVAIAIPVISIYARIIKIFPETDMLDLAQELFGKIAGKVIVLLFTFYAIHLGALVLDNFSIFVEVVSMPETPTLPILLIIMVTALYLAKSGIETLGKWSVIIIAIILVFLLFTIIFSVPYMDLDNLMPVANHSLSDMASGAFQIYSFPFTEIVLFCILSSSFGKKPSPYKIFNYSLLIGGAVLLLVLLRNLLVLGPVMLKSSYFPSYSAVRIIKVGNFLARIESSVSTNFVLAGITKITVCLLAAAKGLASLFDFKDYKNMVAPAAVAIIALAFILYNNAMEMFGFIKYYPYYASLFETVLPIIIWIGAEIKYRKKINRQKASAEAFPV